MPLQAGFSIIRHTGEENAHAFIGGGGGDGGSIVCTSLAVYSIPLLLMLLISNSESIIPDLLIALKASAFDDCIPHSMGENN